MSVQHETTSPQMRLRIGRLPISNYIINKNEDSEKSPTSSLCGVLAAIAYQRRDTWGRTTPLLLNTDPKTDEELLGRIQE